MTKEDAMTRKLFPVLAAIALLSAPALRAQRDDLEPEAAPVASGIGINLTAVARLVGGGGILFKTAVDVTNNTGTASQVDFYFDGTTGGAPVAVNGSVRNDGTLVAQGTGGDVAGHRNIHFDDFVDALVQAGMLPASVEADGVIGSTLFVFGGFSKSGQGAVTARFYNDGCGGTLGQAINGREITTSEPTKLVVTARNTLGEADVPQLYTNLFINNTGLTPTGSGDASAIDVKVSAVSSKTGAAVGTPLPLSGINPGATVAINVFTSLAIPADEDTVLVTIQVTSGTSAIDAVAVAIDDATHDGTTTKAASAAF
jgi:hypothetical protein